MVHWRLYLQHVYVFFPNISDNTVLQRRVQVTPRKQMDLKNATYTYYTNKYKTITVCFWELQLCFFKPMACTIFFLRCSVLAALLWSCDGSQKGIFLKSCSVYFVHCNCDRHRERVKSFKYHMVHFLNKLKCKKIISINSFAHLLHLEVTMFKQAMLLSSYNSLSCD